MTVLLDAYEAISFTVQFSERLVAAQARLAKARGAEEEKQWLDAAQARLSTACAAAPALLLRAARLPGMEAVREEQAGALQRLAIDAVERLQAGITFHAGSRSPLLDSLFGKVKLAGLARLDRAEFEKYCADFEKRLNTQYVKRQLALPAFEFAVPVVEQVRAAFATWRGGFEPEPLSGEEVEVLGGELINAAVQLDPVLRQVRLLAEAALVPVEGAFEEAGLHAKPKKRGAKKVEAPVVQAAAVVEEKVEEAAPVVKTKKAKKVKPPDEKSLS